MNAGYRAQAVSCATHVTNNDLINNFYKKSIYCVQEMSQINYDKTLTKKLSAIRSEKVTRREKK